MIASLPSGKVVVCGASALYFAGIRLVQRSGRTSRCPSLDSMGYVFAIITSTLRASWYTASSSLSSGVSIARQRRSEQAHAPPTKLGPAYRNWPRQYGGGATHG